MPVELFAGYSPHPKAWQAFTDNRRFLMMLAGRRGAKSHTGARRMLRMIYEVDYPRAAGLPYNPGAAKRGTALWWKRRPRLHYWVVSETSDLLKEPMRYILEFLPPDLLEHADSSENTLWLYPDILIEFKSGLLPKRLVSAGLNGLWVDEAARLSGEAWQGYLRPTLSDKAGWAQFTTTPLGKDWTYDQIEKFAIEGEPDYVVHQWVSADNIRAPNVVADVERARRMLPEAYFKREYEASREAFIGQIYPFIDNPSSLQNMVFDALPAGTQIYKIVGGQDWGFTNPGAHVVMGFTSRDPNLAHVWAIDEIYDKSQLVEQFWVPAVRKMMAQWRYNEVVADPAEPDNLMRFKAAGIYVTGHRNFTTSKYDEHERSVRAGIRVLAALMHQGRFHVLRRCKNLIEELKSYRWDQYKTGPMGGELIERPAMGQKDHAATACRYGATYALKGAVFEPLALAA